MFAASVFAFSFFSLFLCLRDLALDEVRDGLARLDLGMDGAREAGHRG